MLEWLFSEFLFCSCTILTALPEWSVLGKPRPLLVMEEGRGYGPVTRIPFWINFGHGQGEEFIITSNQNTHRKLFLKLPPLTIHDLLVEGQICHRMPFSWPEAKNYAKGCSHKSEYSLRLCSVSSTSVLCFQYDIRTLLVAVFIPRKSSGNIHSTRC